MSSISIGEARAGTRRRERTRRASRHDGPEPWSRRDAVVVVLVLAVAVVGLVIGWFGISDTVVLDDQTGWLGFGIGALIVGGFGMVAWLLVGLRRVAVLRREVLVEVNRRHPEPAATRAAVLSDGAFGTVTGMRRYHRAGCQLLAGKAATYAASAVHVEAGLAPCPICLSGEAETGEAETGEAETGEARGAGL